jgi:hypothetical protein
MDGRLFGTCTEHTNKRNKMKNEDYDRKEKEEEKKETKKRKEVRKRKTMFSIVF